jgi:protein-disulfide isomerase
MFHMGFENKMRFSHILISVLMAVTLMSLVSPVALAAADNTDAAEHSDSGADKDSREDIQALGVKLNELKEQFVGLRTELVLLTNQMKQVLVQTQAAVQQNSVDNEMNKGISVSLDDDPALGDEGATVGIVEFSDFQCPFCKRFHTQVFPFIKDNFIVNGKVKFIFRDVPLDFHPKAKLAAIAASCADKQDAFWDYQDHLWENQDQLGEELYARLAGDLNLDQASFDSCIKDPATAKEVETDLAYGEAYGIDGTPTFYIGRIKDNKLVDARPLVGAQPYPVFENMINAYLNESGD